MPGATEPLGHRAGDLRPDARNLLEFLLCRLGQPVHRPEVTGQRLRDDPADLRDAQRGQHPAERLLPGGRNPRQQVLRLLLREPLQPQQVLLTQEVEVGDVVDQAPVHQQLGRLLPQRLNVHRPARGEVGNPADQLGRTGRVGAVDGDLPGHAGYLLPAGRTAVRRRVDLLLARPHVHHRPDDVRNDLPGPFDNHPIADADVFFGDIVKIVQGRFGDGHPADGDGFQDGVGGEDPGSTHVDPDVQETGGCLPAGELVGQHPARRPAHDAQVGGDPQVVDLDDHPVGLVGERIPLSLPLLAGRDGVLKVGAVGGLLRDGEPQRAQILQRLPLGGRRGRLPLVGHHLIAEQTDGPLRGDAGIQLPQGAGGGVAGIGERLLPLLRLATVELLKVPDGHIGLPPDDQVGRGLGAVGRGGDAQGELADGAQVGRYILSHLPIPPGGAQAEGPIPVVQDDAEAVNLGLHDEVQVGAGREESGDALQPGPGLFGAEGVFQAEDRGGVADLGELRGRRRADPLGGRVGRDQFRVLLFQPPQFRHQRVVLRVADDGGIQDVVAVVVIVNFPAQLLHSLTDFFRDHADLHPSCREGDGHLQGDRHLACCGGFAAATKKFPFDVPGTSESAWHVHHNRQRLTVSTW